MTICIRIFLEFFWSEIGGGYNGNSIFNFLKNHQTVFIPTEPILQSHQQCMGVPISPDAYQHLLLSTKSFPTWVWSDFALLIITIAEYLWTCWPFVYLLWRLIYSSSLPIFKISCFSFCYWAVQFLYILWILTLFIYTICEYFLPFCRCSLIFLIMSFYAQKF